MAEHVRVGFHVLGPLEVLAGGRHLDLVGARQRIVLACLVLEAGHVVPLGRLTAAVYGEDPPASARAQIQICVSALRRLLPAGSTIVTRNQGYLLDPGDARVDLRDYERLIGDARAAAGQGRQAEAVSRFREGLALWRGPALEGIDSPVLTAVADSLTEQRLAVAEECFDLELELGRHRELVAELTGLVAAHPLRERLRGQLMLALHRSGRQAEALETYRTARRTLIDELGLEPGAWLRQLEHTILTDGAGADSVPAISGDRSTAPRTLSTDAAGFGDRSAAPRMLPTDVADFTGRDGPAGDIHDRLAGAADAGHRAVPVVVIAGKPGVGKTTLGVHVAHRLAADYPDGQLFADLHGPAAHPAGPEQILERFLRALGVPGAAIPDGLDERAERYRDLLSGRRMLVVLDNVGGESQVLPLLPGDPRAAVVVTSRSRLGGLPGAVHVDLDVLDRGHSVELLSRIAGDERVRSEAGAAAELAELCGRLPLALRIAGARLSARPHWTVEQLAGRLADESRRLDELSHGPLGIRASIALTYDNIGPRARRLFRLLAVPDGPDFAGWTAAALLDRPLDEARDLLDDLADARLVEATGEPGRYRFHDLIRVFARERLVAEETAADRDAASERMLGALLFLVETAHLRLHGADTRRLSGGAPRWTMPAGIVDRLLRDPLTWLEQERQNMIAGVRQAARADAAELCWDLVIGGITLFEQRAYLTDWRDTTEIALAATTRAGDRRGRAAILWSMGSLAVVENRFADAQSLLEEAAGLFGEIGDDQGSAVVDYHLAFLRRMAGDLDEANRLYRAALVRLRAGGDLMGVAYVLHTTAQVELDRGEPGRAGELLREALDLSRRSGSRRIEAQVLHRLGHLRLETGDPAGAVAAFRAALVVVRELGDPIGQAYALNGLGLAHLHSGDPGAAAGALKRARAWADDSGERLIQARIALGMGQVALARGEPGEAVMELESALRLFRDLRADAFAEQASSMLAAARDSAGKPPR